VKSKWPLDHKLQEEIDKRFGNDGWYRGGYFVADEKNKELNVRLIKKPPSVNGKQVEKEFAAPKSNQELEEMLDAFF
jgi:hypothetical protein